MVGSLPSNDPAHPEVETGAVELVLEARPRDLGGFSVRRALPAAQRRLLGPFIFFDQMGPATLPPGQAVDVRPHPHINLATVTYLFAGEIVHRDSLGSHQPIHPGDVNWMLAGRGIVHSERSSADRRAQGGPLDGIQCWVALPTVHEEDPPSFHHHPAASIPTLRWPGAELRVVAGNAYGATSPVGVLSATLYVAATLESGTALPLPDEHAERGAYVVEGTVRCDGGGAGRRDDGGREQRSFGPGTLLVFRRGSTPVLRALTPCRVMLLGGAPLDGPRHIWWNFVSSSEARIERAKQDWKSGAFAKVPGDDKEFIPLPEG